MKKLFFSYLFLFSFLSFSQKKVTDYKFSFQIGSEIRFPILKFKENSQINLASSQGFIIIIDNKDISEYLKADAYYYKLNIRLSSTWFIGFQHSVRYGHVAFLEKNDQSQLTYKYASSLNQFISDYKFFFKKNFNINKMKADIGIGYNLMGYGVKYYLNNPGMLINLSRLTAFDLQTNYHYKYMDLGLGLYIIDYTQFNSVLHKLSQNNRGFGNYVLYFNIGFDIIKF